VPLFGAGLFVCSLLIVNQVLVRLWARRASRVVLASLTVWGFGSGLFGGPWLCRHGCLTRFASLFDDASDCWCGCSVQGRFMCVLSDGVRWLAVGLGVASRPVSWGRGWFLCTVGLAGALRGFSLGALAWV